MARVKTLAKNASSVSFGFRVSSQVGDPYSAWSGSVQIPIRSKALRVVSDRREVEGRRQLRDDARGQAHGFAAGETPSVARPDPVTVEKGVRRPARVHVQVAEERFAVGETLDRGRLCGRSLFGKRRRIPVGRIPGGRRFAGNQPDREYAREPRQLLHPCALSPHSLFPPGGPGAVESGLVRPPA